MRGRLAAIFALVALLPAGVNAAAVPRSGVLAVLICTGDGSVRTASIPAGPDAPGGGGVPCCAKGCHTGGSRKRAACC